MGRAHIANPLPSEHFKSKIVAGNHTRPIRMIMHEAIISLAFLTRSGWAWYRTFLLVSLSARISAFVVRTLVTPMIWQVLL